MDGPRQPDSVDDAERVYRRIPVSQNWFDPAVSPIPSPQAFRPLKYDDKGISLTRVKFHDSPQAACGSNSLGYYIAELSVKRIRALGADVVADPTEADPGHCIIPELTYESRKSDIALEIMNALARTLCEEVHGPFPANPANT